MHVWWNQLELYVWIFEILLEILWYFIIHDVEFLC